MRILLKIIIGVVLVIAGIAAMMLIPSPQPDAPKPWEITIKEDGNPEVFGMHLGLTTYQQAQEKLGDFGEVAIFTDSDAKNSLEAYFESVHLGGLSAKVVLNLAIADTELESMLTRAHSSQLQPSGARQSELSEQDKQIVLQLPVTTITYIPSLRLSKEDIESRFGQADSIDYIKSNTEQKEGHIIETWHYLNYGLQVIFESERKTLLFYNIK